MINLNEVNIEQSGGLRERLQQLTDPRKARGIRHVLTATLTVAICAKLSGARGYLVIGDWAASLSQDLLHRLGCRYDLNKGKYVAPSEPTLRRHLQKIDADKLDQIVNEWLVEQTDPDALAVDAMQTHVKHANYLVEEKGADYLFVVKGNQGCRFLTISVGVKHVQFNVERVFPYVLLRAPASKWIK